MSVGNLRNGHTQSCGCLRKEIASERVLKRNKNYKGKNNPNWKEKEIIICKWCGEEKEVIPSLKERTQFCSKKCYNKWMSENSQGENSPAWKNGITSLYMQVRNSPKANEFTQEILKKANYICLISKEVGEYLHVHHIKGFAKILEENNITTLEEALECEELWDEKNVVVLSEEWHSGIKTNNPNAFHRVYGKINFTEEDFYKWFEEFKVEEE